MPGPFAKYHCAMKLDYGITFSDFAATQPEVSQQSSKNALLGAGSFLLVFAGVGLFLIVSGFRHPETGYLGVGGVFVTLAIAAAGVLYLRDQRSSRSKSERHSRQLEASYRKMHCTDSRTLLIEQDSLTASCKCGSVRRPWAALAGLQETERFFFLRTQSEVFFIPKSAFASQAEVTEFRSLISEHLNTSTPLTGISIRFVYTRQDFFRAKLLHLRKGVATSTQIELALRWVAIPYVLFIVGRFLLVHVFTEVDPGGLVVAVVVPTLLIWPYFRRRRTRLLSLPTEARITNDEVYLQDSLGQGRFRFDSCCAYLEDDWNYIVYHNPKRYRILPKRAFTESQKERFDQIIQSKLSRGLAAC
jgi:membrane protein implicated in regulation of membrane protease activity